MFNLLVGLPNGGALSRDRLLEGTPSHIKDRLNVGSGNYGELLKLPTLAMPEVGPKGSFDIARVGTLSRIDPNGTHYTLQFTPNSNIAPISVTDILANRSAFDVDGEWGFHRTRLTVKDTDLYRTLLEIGQSSAVVRPSRT